MTTTNSNKLLVIYEGQQHWIPEAIAINDQLLRDAFTPLCAELANADIERKPGEPIHIIKKPGKKGASPLDSLIVAPEEINPAVQMCYQMRQRQVITGIDWQNAGQLSVQIEEAIAAGTEFSESLNKAKTLALRYSLAWKMEVTAIAQLFQPEWIVPSYNSLIIVTACVDNAKARESITQVLQHNTHRSAPHIWHLDCGNSKRSGQVLLGSHLSINPNDYDFEALGCFRLPAPTVQQPDLLIPQPEELADNNLSCEQMALLNSQSLSINQRVAAEAFDYLLQLTTGKLRRFATYFDLESGSGKSLYTTQVSIMQAILPSHSCA